MEKVIIFGNTMIAKLAHYYFTRDKKYSVVAFTADAAYVKSSTYFDLPLLPFEDIEKQYPPTDYKMFVAIGPTRMNSLREKKFHEAKAKGYQLVSHISSKAICESPTGENTLVADGVVINPFAKIGNNNFFWEQCYISCDAVIEDNCYFSPQSSVGTFSVINNNSIVSTNASIKTQVIVAEKSLIGSCCFISQNTKPQGVYGEKTSTLYGQISEKINIAAE